MTEQLREIGIRLMALREILDISAEEMAERCKISLEDYLAYEKGDKDFSFSFLYNAAEILNVDVMELMTGDAPKLSNCSFVKKGKGYSIKRGEQYEYRHLAFTFRDKKADPFLVTVSPEKNPHLHSHEGQEFQYLLEGEAEVRIGDTTYVMHPGDSLYINSSTPHALTALNGEPATFLAVVMK